MKSGVKATSRGVPPACFKNSSGTALATTTCMPHRFLPRHVERPFVSNSFASAYDRHLLRLVYEPTAFFPVRSRAVRWRSPKRAKHLPPQISQDPLRNRRFRDCSSSPHMARACCSAFFSAPPYMDILRSYQEATTTPGLKWLRVRCA